MPETKNKTLEEIDLIFSQPTSELVRQNLASVKETTRDLFALRWGRLIRPSPESKLPEGELERRLDSLAGTAGEGEKTGR